jgi:hypothetical protein
MVKWFGPDWGAPICKSAPQVLTPEGSCKLCGDPIAQGNQGFVMPHMVSSPEEVPPRFEEGPVHLECFLLNVGAIKEVHILDAGYSLCNMPGLPSDWPEGHRWVRVEEAKRATCYACKRKMPEA